MYLWPPALWFLCKITSPILPFRLRPQLIIDIQQLNPNLETDHTMAAAPQHSSRTENQSHVFILGL
jgi:hypothetical protein